MLVLGLVIGIGFLVFCFWSFRGEPVEAPKDTGAVPPAVAEKVEIAHREDAPLEDSRRLTAADIARFRPLVFLALDEPRDSDHVTRIEDEVAGFEKERGFSPLIDIAAWAGMQEAHHVESISRNPVLGAGLIQSDVAFLRTKGELLAFGYSYVLPRNYDHQRRWPVLLCLPGGHQDAAGYLRDVWVPTPVDQDLSDGFILVAPDLRETTLGKDFDEGRSVEKRIAWFDPNFLRSILLPLAEVRRQFHIDPEKIFIEGLGEGADAALELAAQAPGRFAGVISRRGELRELDRLPALLGHRLLLLDRPHGLYRDSRGASIGLLAAVERAEGCEYELLELLDQGLDPTRAGESGADLLREGNPAIAAMIAVTRLVTRPDKIHLVARAADPFKSHPLAKMTAMDEDGSAPASLELSFDRSANRIEARSRSVYDFSIFLGDQVLDLDRPIDVVLDGARLEGRLVMRDVKFLIKDMIGRPYDYHQSACAVLRVQVPD